MKNKEVIGLGLFVALVAGSSASAGNCPSPTTFTWFPDNFLCDQDSNLGDQPLSATRFGSQGKWKLFTFASGWSIQRVNASPDDFLGIGQGGGSTSGANCQGQPITGCAGGTLIGESFGSTVYGLGRAGYGQDDFDCPGARAYAESQLLQQSSQTVEILLCSANYVRTLLRSSCVGGGCSEKIAQGAYAVVATATPTYEIVGPRTGTATFFVDADLAFPNLAGVLESSAAASTNAFTIELQRLVNGQVVETIDRISGAISYDTDGNLSHSSNLSQNTAGDWVIDLSESYSLSAGTYRFSAAVATIPTGFGDVNGDSRLDTADVSALQALIGQPQPMPNGFGEYDFDGSGGTTITASDVDALQDFVDAANSSLLLGDNNFDGVISCSDGTGTSPFSSGLVVGDAGFSTAADFDRDGALTASDEREFNAIYYPAVPGDANRDGDVDLQDQNLVLAAFGSSVTPWSNNDLNGDGMVNLQDLNLVTSNSGATCP